MRARYLNYKSIGMLYIQDSEMFNLKVVLTDNDVNDGKIKDKGALNLMLNLAYLATTTALPESKTINMLDVTNSVDSMTLTFNRLLPIATADDSIKVIDTFLNGDLNIITDEQFEGLKENLRASTEIEYSYQTNGIRTYKGLLSENADTALTKDLLDSITKEEVIELRETVKEKFNRDIYVVTDLEETTTSKVYTKLKNLVKKEKQEVVTKVHSGQRFDDKLERDIQVLNIFLNEVEGLNVFNFPYIKVALLESVKIISERLINKGIVDISDVITLRKDNSIRISIPVKEEVSHHKVLEMVNKWVLVIAEVINDKERIKDSLKLDIFSLLKDPMYLINNIELLTKDLSHPFEFDFVKCTNERFVFAIDEDESLDLILTDLLKKIKDKQYTIVL